MIRKSAFSITLILLSLLINNCICSSSKTTTDVINQEIGDKEKIDKGISSEEVSNKEEVTVPQSCIADADCPTGFSCWHELPRGPLPGTPGSKEKSGKCYRNEAIRKIY